MADEEDPWGSDDVVENPETVNIPSSDTKPTEEATETTKSVEDATEPPAEESALPPPPPEDDGYRKPVQLYRHWVRPQFLQYKYMYNYRTNYYNDVIDYLDKKQVGVTREIPRPQTWAERVLRTNNVSGRDLESYVSSSKRDNQLVQTLAASIRTHNYHTKAYINQKYAHVL